MKPYMHMCIYIQIYVYIYICIYIVMLQLIDTIDLKKKANQRRAQGNIKKPDNNVKNFIPQKLL